MPQRVLDIGNCGPDHGAITQLVTAQFDAVVDGADRAGDALKLLADKDYALVMVNRLLDIDGSPGMDVIKSVKEQYPDLPVMLITNFEEHQQAAVAEGCVPGFGKRELSSNSTVELLGQYLA